MAASLNQQIVLVQQHLAQHRLESALHAATLQQGLRERLASPLALLTAGAVGFAINRLLPWRSNKPGAGSAAPWTKLLDAIALLTALVNLIPSANKKS